MILGDVLIIKEFIIRVGEVVLLIIVEVLVVINNIYKFMIIGIVLGYNVYR